MCVIIINQFFFLLFQMIVRVFIWCQSCHFMVDCLHFVAVVVVVVATFFAFRIWHPLTACQRFKSICNFDNCLRGFFYFYYIRISISKMCIWADLFSLLRWKSLFSIYFGFNYGIVCGVFRTIREPRPMWGCAFFHGFLHAKQSYDLKLRRHQIHSVCATWSV